MNNRDPFNLRRSKVGPTLLPFQSLLQNSAVRAVDISRQVAEQGKQALEQGKQALEQGRQVLEQTAQSVTNTSSSAVGGEAKRKRSDARDCDRGVEEGEMSFSLPRNVPNFQDPSRGYENAAWNASGKSRFPGGGAVSSVFGNGGTSPGLPMYKDKPYNYAASGRRLGWFRKRRLLALIGVVILGWLYWQGALFGARSPAEKGFEAAWRFWGSGGGAAGGEVDWSERREMVKDAFKLSWASYERHAWGRSYGCILQEW